MRSRHPVTETDAGNTLTQANPLSQLAVLRSAIVISVLILIPWLPAQASDHFNRLDEVEKSLSADDLFTKGEAARRGNGRTKDFKAASAYFELAAQKGHRMAQYRMGFAYRQGYGVDLDQKKAYFWFLKAAQQGHLPARNYVGLMHKDGLGVDQNAEEAVRHIRIAAERGDKHAMSNMGNFYRDGLGVELDYAGAYYWYSLAVENYYQKAEGRKKFAGEQLSAAEKDAVDQRVKSWQVVITPPAR